MRISKSRFFSFPITKRFESPFYIIMNIGVGIEFTKVRIKVNVDLSHQSFLTSFI